MRKAAFGMLVVLALTFGPVPMGESAKAKKSKRANIGCISIIQQDLDPTRGRASLRVFVGTLILNFQPGKKISNIRIGGKRGWLTPNELAAREPLLIQFRAGAAARVKARIWYNKSTKAVTAFAILFNTPCK